MFYQNVNIRMLIIKGFAGSLLCYKIKVQMFWFAFGRKPGPVRFLFMVPPILLLATYVFCCLDFGVHYRHMCEESNNRCRSEDFSPLFNHYEKKLNEIPFREIS